MKESAGRAVLLDSNLLLVFVVGTIDQNQISRFKRTSSYTIEDYILLSSLIDSAVTLVTTPHILTEVSNLAGQLTEPLRSAARDQLRKFVELAIEEVTPASELVVHDSYKRLGITDAAIQTVSSDRLTVVTDDFDLYMVGSRSGAAFINFNHLRSLYL